MTGKRHGSLDMECWGLLVILMKTNSFLLHTSHDYKAETSLATKWLASRFKHALNILLIPIFFHRHSSEPPVENGLIPYLGCALQFGANPLQFLRSRQKKYGHIFTCKIAGQYIHFLCDPFSYHSVIRQGRHLDWRKFHFATSVKVWWKEFIFKQYIQYCGFLWCCSDLQFYHSPKSCLFSIRHLATTASTLVMATPLRISTKPFWRPCRVRLCPPS